MHRYEYRTKLTDTSKIESLSSGSEGGMKVARRNNAVRRCVSVEEVVGSTAATEGRQDRKRAKVDDETVAEGQVSNEPQNRVTLEEETKSQEVDEPVSSSAAAGGRKPLLTGASDTSNLSKINQRLSGVLQSLRGEQQYFE